MLAIVDRGSSSCAKTVILSQRCGAFALHPTRQRGMTPFKCSDSSCLGNFSPNDQGQKEPGAVLLFLSLIRRDNWHPSGPCSSNSHPPFVGIGLSSETRDTCPVDVLPRRTDAVVPRLGTGLDVTRVERFFYRIDRGPVCHRLSHPYVLIPSLFAPSEAEGGTPTAGYGWMVDDDDIFLGFPVMPKLNVLTVIHATGRETASQRLTSCLYVADPWRPIVGAETQITHHRATPFSRYFRCSWVFLTPR